MNPQGPRQPGGGEHRPRPGGYPAGNPAPFDQQETQQGPVFRRPPQAPHHPQPRRVTRLTAVRATTTAAERTTGLIGAAALT
ncbi:hypothetical protein EXE63_00075 (plasmid) [Mycolicibacterium frederiksbergense]|uniref:Uncharacterized protein n=1 Tax=Mycolicibacterium frederiksbergense TaxID=117567 RepID=A0A6H0RWI9_9MYCO|nr:hypothetical protein EXE63_00075 [Mycolicibacterium frederiksbergense]